MSDSAKINQQQSKIVARNQLAVRRLLLLEQFFDLYKTIQCLMDEYRLNIMRAKSSLAGSTGIWPLSALLLPERELSPEIWVETAEHWPANCALFTLTSHPNFVAGNEKALRKRTTPNNGKGEDEKAANSKRHNNWGTHFRPFGILESQTVKAARKNIQTLLPILCDLANIQSQILSLERGKH